MDFKQLDTNIPEDAKLLRSLVWWENNPHYVPRKCLDSRIETNYLNYSWRGDHPRLKEIVDTLYLAMPFQGKYKIVAKKQHIEGVVTFLFISRMFVDKWIAFWRKKSAYSKPKDSPKSRYENVTNYSYDFTKIITDYLIENKYVDFEVGQWGKNKEGNLSRMRPTKKFFNLFHEIKMNDLYTVAETVLLREDDSTSGKKHFIEYDENVFTTNARNNLSLINEVIRAHHYSLHLPNTVPQRTLDFLKSRMPNINFYETNLTRKFNNDFENGGRFYGGFWQRLPNRDIPFRSRIRIDNEPATEIDFSNLHMSIAYNHFIGIASPIGDMYQIPPFPNNQINRKFVKQTLLRTFNVKSKGLLKNSLTGSIRSGELILPSTVISPDSQDEYFDMGQYLIEHGNAMDFDTAIDLILEHHEKLKSVRFTLVGGRLQYLDSQLAERIMLSFATKGKACLPMHDSFIVKKSDQKLLLTIMKEEYEKMFHFPINVDIEF